jgi:uncharacterized protein
MTVAVSRLRVAALCCLFALPALAQRTNVRDQVGAGRVTILTDGITDPSSLSVRAVNELTEQLAPGGIRVLPIAGQGAVANIRDLLFLRGVDLAIVNSDVLGHLDMTGEFPDARRRVRFISQLFDQKVYVLARKDLKSIDDLRGRKVAIAASPGTSRLTARTLFGLRQIDVTLQSINTEQALTETALGGIDGVVLFGGELPRLINGAAGLKDFHILPVSLNPALQKVYRSERVDDAEFSGVARSAAVIDTIVVSTVLATFDWNAQQSRYANVTGFVDGFFGALPKLREASANPLWRQVDLKASPPGWAKYASADPGKVLTQAQLTRLASIEKPIAKSPEPLPSAALSSPAPKAISVLATSRAPLADEQSPDGGVITALLNKGLAMSRNGDAKAPQTTVQWTKSSVPALQAAGSSQSVDVLLPWEQSDCDRPNDLSQASAMLCDNALMSDSILQVVIGLFSLAESGFKFETDASIQGRTICVPFDRDLTELSAPGRNWIAEKRITLVRQPTLLDCIGLVQRRDADSFVSSDIEGRHLLRRLGLEPLFAMAERPLGTRTVHAAIPKANQGAQELLERVNAAIRQLRESDVHAVIVRQHLMSLWDPKTNVR